jgi:hypothetical protein
LRDRDRKIAAGHRNNRKSVHRDQFAVELTQINVVRAPSKSC